MVLKSHQRKGLELMPEDSVFSFQSRISTAQGCDPDDFYFEIAFQLQRRAFQDFSRSPRVSRASYQCNVRPGWDGRNSTEGCAYDENGLTYER